MSEVLMFGLLAGLASGAVPMFIGMSKDQMQLGFTALIVSAISGMILGLLLALPVSGFFVWLIIKKDKSQKEKI